MLMVAQLASPEGTGGLVVTTGLGEVYVTLLAHMIPSSSGTFKSSELVGCIMAHAVCAALRTGEPALFMLLYF